MASYLNLRHSSTPGILSPLLATIVSTSHLTRLRMFTVSGIVENEIIYSIIMSLALHGMALQASSVFFCQFKSVFSCPFWVLIIIFGLVLALEVASRYCNGFKVQDITAWVSRMKARCYLLLEKVD